MTESLNNLLQTVPFVFKFVYILLSSGHFNSLHLHVLSLHVCWIDEFTPTDDTEKQEPKQTEYTVSICSDC